MFKRKPRDRHGDAPLTQLLIYQTKAEIKRRIAPRGTPVSPPDSPYLVVPILGQSNAYGMGMGIDPDGLDSPHPRVHQYAMSGPDKHTVILARDPLMHEIPGKGVGFGMTFAKRLADATGRHVLLIPGARGDTSFYPKNGYTWDMANTKTRVNLYRRGIKAVDAVLARYPGSEVAAILWHQGESDVPHTPGRVYQGYLDGVIDDLRRRYGKRIPFLLGQMSPDYPNDPSENYWVIDAVHVDTPNRRERTAFVPGRKDCLNGEADLHYNAVAQRAFGEGMWEHYQQMCSAEIEQYAIP